MMTVQQCVDNLTPYLQKALADNEDDFRASLKAYASSHTGVLGSIFGGIVTVFESPFFWTFLLNTILPFFLKITIFVLITLFAPYLGAFDGLINSIIDGITNSGFLSETQKTTAISAVQMIRAGAAATTINTNLTTSEKLKLLSNVDHLEKYAQPTNNSLFVRR
jgi:hypothetical protein